MIITDVQRYLPQRPPILMLDRVIDLEPGVRGTGVRLFHASASFFAGHFPGQPVLPGIYLIESFAQTALIVVASLAAPAEDDNAALGYLAKIVDAAFYQVVVPGDLVHFEVALAKRLRQFQTATCTATCAGKRIARAELTLALPQVKSTEPQAPPSAGA